MKRKQFCALMLSLALLIAALFGGCSVSLNLDDNSAAKAEPLEQPSSTVSAITNSQTPEQKSAAPKTSKTDGSAGASQAAKKTYTMADIKALKNTEHFAKNTLEHIFDGTINSKGNATGYHYNQVTDSKGSIIKGTESQKDKNGVFTAKVKVGNVKKNGFSSFYPEEWSPQQVVDAINEAYADAISDKSNPHNSLWIGYSGDLEIDMYLNNQKQITTAYPVRKGGN